MNDKATYSLYAMLCNAENREIAETYRFHRITVDYILIYTHEEAPSAAVPVETSNLRRLTRNDENWLMMCNVALIAEETQKHQQDVSQNISDMISLLETALEDERQRGEDEHGG